MNRTNCIRIKLSASMLEAEFQEYIALYGIQWTEEAAKAGKVPCIWMSWHDEQIFNLTSEPLEIISGLRLWIDDGIREIRINEGNYKEYDSALFYKIRKGIYDIEEEV